MPSTWKRSPEELHKTYIANTDAFYRAAGRGLSGELDEFVTNCALQLWKHSGAITQAHADAANQLYSKGSVMPKWLLWELTGKAAWCHRETWCYQGPWCHQGPWWGLPEL